MRNTVILLSCVAFVGLVACEEGKPRRNNTMTGGAGTSATGTAGTSAAGGTTGAAGTDATGSAGTQAAAAGTTGAAGTEAAAGTTGAAGTQAAGGTTGAAGTEAAGGTTGAAGTGAAGTDAAPVACMNSTVVTAGATEANCGAKTAWMATAMPTPAHRNDIPDNQMMPPYAIDGMTTTRYSSGATMADGFYFQVDLGAAKKISGIVVTTNGTGTDAAVGYEVGVSMDGTTFTKVSMCAAQAAAVETVNFAAAMARYVRYTNKGAPLNGATSWLSIHEFSVVCNN